MKKVVLLVMSMWVITAFAQDSTKCKFNKYISLGLSLSNNTDFKSGSYSSLEFGLMSDDISFGAVFGRGNLNDAFNKNDIIGNYFYELKVSPSYKLGKLSGNIVLGYGGYFSTSHNFIEYGNGISYTHKKLTYGILVSNWDGVDYITPSITFNF
jgi:hypothetical protein